jgi:hypothetical protein
MGETKKAGERSADLYEAIYNYANDTRFNLERKPFVTHIPIGTGLGKTYAVWDFAVRAIKGYRNTVIIYIAPQRENLEIDNNFKFKFPEYIPNVRIFSEAELTEPSSRNNIYRIYEGISHMSKRDFLNVLEDIFSGREKIRVEFKSGDTDLDVVDDIDDENYITSVFISATKTVNKDGSVSFTIKAKKNPQSIISSIIDNLDIIGKIEHSNRRDADREKYYQLEIKKLLVNTRLLLTILYDSGIGAELNKFNEYKIAYKFYRELLEKIFGWIVIQEYGGGVVRVTSKKLVSPQFFLKVKSVDDDKPRISAANMENIINNSFDGGGIAYNISNASFILFVDESEESKREIEEQLYSPVLSNHDTIIHAINLLSFPPLSAILDSNDTDCNSSLECEEIRILRNRFNKIVSRLEEFYKHEGIPITRERLISLIKDVHKFKVTKMVLSGKTDADLILHGITTLFSPDSLLFSNYHVLDDIYVRFTNVGEVEKVIEVVTNVSDKEKESLYTLLELFLVASIIVDLVSMFKDYDKEKADKALENITSDKFQPENLYAISKMLFESRTMFSGPLLPILNLFKEKKYVTVREINEFKDTWSTDDKISTELMYKKSKIFFVLNVPKDIRKMSYFTDRSKNGDGSSFLPLAMGIYQFMLTPEFVIERMVSRRAFRYQFKGLKDASDSEKENVNAVFFISATGGRRLDFANDFSVAYFKDSDSVYYVNMFDFKDLVMEIKKIIDERAKAKKDSKVYLVKDNFILDNDPLVAYYEEIIGDFKDEEDFNVFKENELLNAISFISRFANITDDGVMSDLKKKRSALMVTQSPRFIKRFFQNLSKFKNNANFSSEEIVPDTLYYLQSGGRTDGVLIIFFSASTESTLEREYRQYPEKKNRVKEILGTVFDSRLSEIDNLLNPNAKCKVLLCTAWNSGSRSYNFVLQTSENDGTPIREDFDIIYLVNTPHYSKVKFDPEDDESILNDILVWNFFGQRESLMNKSNLPDLKDFYNYSNPKLVTERNRFIREQHYLYQYNLIQQAVGRVDRTDSEKGTLIIIGKDVLISVLRGIKITSKDEQLLSPLNMKLVEEVQRLLTDITMFPSDEFLSLQDDYVNRYIDAKNALLKGIRERDKKAIRIWQIIHSGLLLTNPEKFFESLRKEGFETDIISNLFITKPQDGKQYMVTKRTVRNEEVDYLTDKYSVNTDWYPDYEWFEIFSEVINNKFGGKGLYFEINGEIRIPHPVLLTDIKGIIGESLAKEWFKKQFSKNPIDVRKNKNGRNLVQLFEEFDLYYDFDGILVCVDAKNWNRTSDQIMSGKTIRKYFYGGKKEKVENVVRENKYKGFIAVYFDANFLRRDNAMYSEVISEDLMVINGYRLKGNSISMLNDGKFKLEQLINMKLGGEDSGR